MRTKKILVTGASIAGPTTAYWLTRYGFEVILVERSPELRLGGQNIDVKGPARDISRRMGIESAIAGKNTTEVGLRFVNTRNKTIAEFPKDSSLSMTQELEILRGDLVQILYDLTKTDVEYRFNDYVTGVTHTEHNVQVTFFSGKKEDFDLLIVAEGIGSQTRNLTFGGETEFNYLGLHTAYFTIARSVTDSSWARWHNAEKGIVFLLRPDNYGTTRASVTFTAKEDEYKNLTVEEQKAALVARVQGSGWESDRLVKEIKNASDLYFDRVSQVKSPVWAKERVVLVGDAAYCATPIAGKGTDLAMSGAYILAGELSIAKTYQDGFAAYEKKMRPYVEKCQKLPPGIPALVYPQSKLGVRMLEALVSVAGSRPVKWISSLFGAKTKTTKREIILPEYPLEERN